MGKRDWKVIGKPAELKWDEQNLARKSSCCFYLSRGTSNRSLKRIFSGDERI